MPSCCIATSGIALRLSEFSQQMPLPTGGGFFNLCGNKICRMKLFLPVAAVAVIIVLAAALVLAKRSDTAQLDTANGSIADFSNHLDTAQLKLAAREGTILTLSNSLTECASAALTFSNQLAAAQSTNDLQAGQITGLNQRLADAAAEKQVLDKNIANLGNQMAALSNRLAQTEASLTLTNQALVQAGKDYALLKDRFLRDVAARTIVERRFNNLIEVQAQEEKLKKAGAPWVTQQSIYAGLDVEVKSNGVVHVLAPE
jgi:septal ring factor EnvC (AmiA/AmiB activator)